MPFTNKCFVRKSKILIALLAVSTLVAQTTKVDAPTQIKRLNYLDVRQFPLPDGTSARPNDNTVCNDVPINAAIASAYAAGGGTVYVGQGEWWTCATVYIPTGVWLVGASYGVPVSDGTQYGTVLSASPSFSAGFTGSSFSKNFIAAINGSGPRISTGSAQLDTTDAQVWNLTLNCNNIPGCGAGYKGHANEQSGFHNVTFKNFLLAGLYTCGQGMQTYADSVCGAGNSGAVNDGPDESLIFYPAAGFSGQIISANGVAFSKGAKDITIHGSGAGIAGIITGTGYKLDNVNFSYVSNGFSIGSGAPVCPLSSCASMNYFDAKLIYGPAAGTTAGQNTFSIYSISTSSLHNIYGGGSSCGAVDISGTCTSTSLNYLEFDSLGHPYSDDSNVSMTFFNPVQFSNGLLSNSYGNQVGIANPNAPTGSTFYLNMDSSGNLEAGNANRSGNLELTNPYAVLSLVGGTSALTGLNIQALDGAPNESGIRGTFCSDAYWNTATSLWQIGNNGASDYACAFLPAQGGFAVSASPEIQPATLPDAAFIAETSFWITPNGITMIGPNALANADSGSTLQVTGSASISGVLNAAGVANSANQTVAGNSVISGTEQILGALNVGGTETLNPGANLNIANGTLYVNGAAQVTGQLRTNGLLTSGPVVQTATGNTDNKGKLIISSSNNSATYAFQGTYTQSPVCTTSLEGGVINGFSSPIISGGGTSWTLTVHTSINLSATADYICEVTP